MQARHIPFANSFTGERLAEVMKAGTVFPNQHVIFPSPIFLCFPSLDIDLGGQLDCFWYLLLSDQIEALISINVDEQKGLHSPGVPFL